MAEQADALDSKSGFFGSMGSTPISDTMKNLILKYCYFMYDGWQRRKTHNVDFGGRVTASIFVMILSGGALFGIIVSFMQEPVLTILILMGIIFIIGTPYVAVLIGRHMKNKPQ